MGMDDAEAELRLRPPAPYERAEAHTKMLRAEFKRLSPDARSEELERDIEEFSPPATSPRAERPEGPPMQYLFSYGTLTRSAFIRASKGD